MDQTDTKEDWLFYSRACLEAANRLRDQANSLLIQAKQYEEIMLDAQRYADTRPSSVRATLA